MRLGLLDLFHPTSCTSRFLFRLFFCGWDINVGKGSGVISVSLVSVLSAAFACCSVVGELLNRIARYRGDAPKKRDGAWLDKRGSPPVTSVKQVLPPAIVTHTTNMSPGRIRYHFCRVLGPRKRI